MTPTVCTALGSFRVCSVIVSSCCCCCSVSFLMTLSLARFLLHLCSCFFRLRLITAVRVFVAHVPADRCSFYDILCKWVFESFLAIWRTHLYKWILPTHGACSWFLMMISHFCVVLATSCFRILAVSGVILPNVKIHHLATFLSMAMLPLTWRDSATPLSQRTSCNLMSLSVCNLSLLQCLLLSCQPLAYWCCGQAPVCFRVRPNVSKKSPSQQSHGCCLGKLPSKLKVWQRWLKIAARECTCSGHERKNIPKWAFALAQRVAAMGLPLRSNGKNNVKPHSEKSRGTQPRSCSSLEFASTLSVLPLIGRVRLSCIFAAPRNCCKIFSRRRAPRHGLPGGTAVSSWARHTPKTCSLWSLSCFGSNWQCASSLGVHLCGDLCSNGNMCPHAQSNTHPHQMLLVSTPCRALKDKQLARHTRMCTLGWWIWMLQRDSAFTEQPKFHTTHTTHAPTPVRHGWCEVKSIDSRKVPFNQRVDMTPTVCTALGSFRVCSVIVSSCCCCCSVSFLMTLSLARFLLHLCSCFFRLRLITAVRVFVAHVPADRCSFYDILCKWVFESFLAIWRTHLYKWILPTHGACSWFLMMISHFCVVLATSCFRILAVSGVILPNVKIHHLATFLSMAMLPLTWRDSATPLSQRTSCNLMSLSVCNLSLLQCLLLSCQPLAYWCCGQAPVCFRVRPNVSKKSPSQQSHGCCLGKLPSKLKVWQRWLKIAARECTCSGHERKNIPKWAFALAQRVAAMGLPLRSNGKIM